MHVAMVVVTKLYKMNVHNKKIINYLIILNVLSVMVLTRNIQRDSRKITIFNLIFYF
jgi:hypothetical protein